MFASTPRTLVPYKRVRYEGHVLAPVHERLRTPGVDLHLPEHACPGFAVHEPLGDAFQERSGDKTLHDTLNAYRIYRVPMVCMTHDKTTGSRECSGTNGHAIFRAILKALVEKRLVAVVEAGASPHDAFARECRPLGRAHFAVADSPGNAVGQKAVDWFTV